MVMYLGIALLVIALIALAVGVLQRMKMKAILSAPFKKTGELNQGQGAGGVMSAQGAIRADQPLVAPCSGKQCLYYEIEIKQEWEKHVKTENGMKKQTGKDNAHSHKEGSIFGIDDGSGAVAVDASQGGVDCKLEKSFSEKQSYGWGDVQFGSYRVHVNRPTDSSKNARALYCVEKIIPPQGELFVMGKLEGNRLQKKDGMLGKLVMSNKGRDALVGSTKRNSMIGLVAGAVLLLSGGVMAIVGEPPAAAADTCADMVDAPAAACQGRMYSAEDDTMPWTVATPGVYRFTAVGTGTDPYMRIWPDVRIKDGTGNVVFAMSASDGAPITAQGEFGAGTYTIHINDTQYGWQEDLQGGAGYSLTIEQLSTTVQPEALPAEGEALPAEGEAAPAEGEAAPAGEEAAPAAQ